jgi:hypothetical protein
MAKFTTRVELHDAKTWEDYDKLHAAMEKKGFSRTIVFGGITYQLPTAEYNYVGEVTRDQVLELAKSAATATGHKFCVLVTESAGRVMHNLKPV